MPFASEDIEHERQNIRPQTTSKWPENLLVFIIIQSIGLQLVRKTQILQDSKNFTFPGINNGYYMIPAYAELGGSRP